jgi:hypothetical protein
MLTPVIAGRTGSFALLRRSLNADGALNVETNVDGLAILPRIGVPKTEGIFVQSLDV